MSRATCHRSGATGVGVKTVVRGKTHKGNAGQLPTCLPDAAGRGSTPLPGPAARQ